MNKDAQLIAEAYNQVVKGKTEPKKVSNCCDAPETYEHSGLCSKCKEHAEFAPIEETLTQQNVVTEGETWGVEGKLKSALADIEGLGYTGDGIDTMEVARLVAGHSGGWGDEYEPLVQALTHVIGAYHGRGIQDS